MEGSQSSEVFHTFAITVLGDNTLSKPVWDHYRDLMEWKTDYFTIAPHVLCQTGKRQVFMGQQMYIWNLSGSRRSLEQLPYESAVSRWESQCQDVTVLGLGAQDLIRGIYGMEQVYSSVDFWEDKFTSIVQAMTERKRQMAQNCGWQQQFARWRWYHKWVIFVLPALPAEIIESCGKISEADYFQIRRDQIDRFRNSRVKARLRELNIFSLSPNISKPEFEDGRLKAAWAQSYVQPVITFVQEHFCSRCKKPTLKFTAWHRSVFCNTEGEVDPVLNALEGPDNAWECVISMLSVFDTGILKQVCKAFYRLCHSMNRVEKYQCRGPLDIEVEAARLLTPED